MSLDAYKSGRVTQAAHDGNREFITLMAYVSAIGKRGSPTLLYKGASRDLQDTWLDDFTDSDQAFFGVSKNGWSSKEYGLK
jgi:hypothetical protein